MPPDVLDGIQFRRSRRQEDQRHILREIELVGRAPAGAVEQQDSVSAARDATRDFVQAHLHRLSVGVGQCKRRPFATRGTDGSKQIGVLIALTGGLTRSRSTPRPLANLSVLVADPGFILEPNLDWLALRDMGEMRLQRLAEVFLNAAIVSAFWPGWRGRALMCEKPRSFRSLPIERS